ncbi:MAG: hypothetical protein QOK05_2512 [Chloroflexota bacterium]|jgi:hypothetical protein|nr:hypothetical protein [Chloroflexota bacterium]
MMIKHRKPTALKVTSQVRELGSRLSFLDVLRDACDHNGRYTLNAESNGQVFTVLVDRGGPFNAIGGGSAGSPALVAAAQLRSGRCTITIGWPVDQPLYQPGLDLTLKALVDGAVAPASLPRHRGVDSLRNAEWRDVEPQRAADAWQPPVAPPVLPVINVKPVPAPPPVVSEPLYAPPPMDPAPETPAAPVPTAFEAQSMPAATSFPTRPWVRPSDEPEVIMPATTGGTDGVLPAGDRTGAAVETAKHFATQALLWLCEVEPGDEYTLPEAAALARQNLFSGISQGLHPFRREMGSKIERVKQDWAKSGEVAARASRKKRVRAVVASDPDEEFRLF